MAIFQFNVKPSDSERSSVVAGGPVKYQKIRKSFTCPFHKGSKNYGELACDTCRVAYGVDNNNPEATRYLDQVEQFLEKMP